MTTSPPITFLSFLNKNQSFIPREMDGFVFETCFACPGMNNVLGTSSRESAGGLSPAIVRAAALAANTLQLHDGIL